MCVCIHIHAAVRKCAGIWYNLKMHWNMARTKVCIALCCAPGMHTNYARQWAFPFALKSIQASVCSALCQSHPGTERIYQNIFAICPLIQLPYFATIITLPLLPPFLVLEHRGRNLKWKNISKFLRQTSSNYNSNNNRRFVRDALQERDKMTNIFSSLQKGQWAL